MQGVTACDVQGQGLRFSCSYLCHPDPEVDA
jgi:hypothetical protein